MQYLLRSGCSKGVNHHNIIPMQKNDNDHDGPHEVSFQQIWTLSITQFACERSFSTLKFVKNRLRSSLSQDNLEAFMLMCTEKEILMSISNDTVIDKVAETSALLRRLLMLLALFAK